ncbi:MAG: PEP-CTERM sorting domain-containing protein [Planctomycetota bacterium]
MPSKQVFFTRSLALAASFLALGTSTQAQLTHEISFGDLSYPAGFELEALGGSDLGFGVNLWSDSVNFTFPPPFGTGSTIVEGSLVDPQGLLPTSGNRRVSSAEDDEMNANPFNLSFYSFELGGDVTAKGEPEDALGPGEYWLSFLAKSEANAFFGGVSLVKFFGDEVLYIGKVGGEGGSEWGLDQGVQGPVGVAGSDSTTDTLLVAKITIGASGNDDFVDLFINPTLGTLPTTPDIAGYQFNEDPAALNGDGNRIRQIDELRLGSQNGVFEVDEIRLGATFFDVTIAEINNPGVLGDFNESGSVEQGDLNLVLNNWGTVRTFDDPAGTVFGSLLVDQEELNAVLNNWGSSSAPSFEGSAIPEPASLALLGGFAVAGLRRRTH